MAGVTVSIACYLLFIALIMYLHLGQSVVVAEDSVVGIFDLDNTTGSHITRKFLSEAEKDGRVTAVSDELPKAFVVCGMDCKPEIYLSQLSSATLYKRGKAAFIEEKVKRKENGTERIS